MSIYIYPLCHARILLYSHHIPLYSLIYSISPFSLGLCPALLTILSVGVTLATLIVSYIIVDRNLMISVCLLVIFFMTFMLILILFVKPKIVANTTKQEDETIRCENNVETHEQRQPKEDKQEEAKTTTTTTTMTTPIYSINIAISLTASHLHS